MKEQNKLYVIRIASLRRYSFFLAKAIPPQQKTYLRMSRRYFKTFEEKIGKK